MFSFTKLFFLKVKYYLSATTRKVCITLTLKTMKYLWMLLAKDEWATNSKMTSFLPSTTITMSPFWNRFYGIERASHLAFYLIPSTSWHGDKICVIYPSFTAGDWGSQRLYYLSKDTQLIMSYLLKQCFSNVRIIRKCVLKIKLPFAAFSLF